MTNEKILKKSVNKWGIDYIHSMCIKEMSELTQAILKWRRKLGDDEMFKNLIEEMVDVDIMMSQMKHIYCGEKGLYDTIYQQKIDKLKERLES